MRGWRYVGAAAVLSLVLVSPSSSASWSWHEGSLDVVSSAQPTEADPAVHDEASTEVWVRRRHATADAVATSSAGCDGCRGAARTVQLVFATRPGRLHADNVATAWASCVDCSASAVSVQVVLARRAAGVTANNRALAVNAKCTGCLSSAAAYQVVLVSRRWADVDRLRERLLAWARDPASAPPPGLRTRTTGPAPGQHARARVRDLAALVAEQTHGRVVRTSAVVRTGG